MSNTGNLELTKQQLTTTDNRQIVIQFNKLSGAGNEKADKFSQATVVSLYLEYDVPGATREREWLCDFAQIDSREAYTHVFLKAAQLSMLHSAPIANFDWK